MRKTLLTATALTAALAFAGGSALAQTATTGTASRIPSATSQTTGQTSGAMSGTQSGQSASTNMAAGSTLASLQNAKTTLKQAKVEDSAGARIGKVKSVQTGSNGNPLAIEVSLTSNNKTVRIPASDLRYEKSSKTLRAELTKAQIEKMAKGGGTNQM